MIEEMQEEKTQGKVRLVVSNGGERLGDLITTKSRK